MATDEDTRRPATGLVVLGSGLALMAALSWRIAGRLPDEVSFAGTGRHGADQHAAEAFVLAAMPVLTLVIAVLSLGAQRLRRLTATVLRIPLWRDERTHRRAVDLLLGVLVPVLLTLHILVLRAADGQAGSGLGLAATAVAVAVVVLGNLWPKRVPEVPAAARMFLTPGAERDLTGGTEAQRRSRRPTGIAMVLLGLVALACAGFAPLISLGVSLSAVLVLGGVLGTTAIRGTLSPQR